MGLKAPAASLQWSQPSVPQSPPPSSQALASAVAASPSSSTSLRRSVSLGDIYRSSMFAAQQPTTRLYKSRSCENLRSRVRRIRRALSASSDSSFPEDESNWENQESGLVFRMNEEGGIKEPSKKIKSFDLISKNTKLPERDEIVRPDIEGAANGLKIPSPLGIMNHRKLWQEGLVEARESAYCSVKKAFSSMVFIIRELHSYTLHMREILFYEDLQGILAIVHKEMNDSFVWLFQKIFSQTPNLMVCLMILLANYSVYSMSNNAAISAISTVSTVEMAPVAEAEEALVKQKFDPLGAERFSPSSPSSNGKTTSIGENGGGGGKCGTITSGTDDNDRESNHYKTITPADVITSKSRNLSENIVSPDEEARIWESMVNEARKMHDDFRHESLDNGTMLKFVSPVDAKVEADDSSENLRTEFLYQIRLTRDPENPLLLVNYAQFLYLVARDYERAEEYFKRATKAEPKDAESFNKYANFLWLARKDLWAAEEAYLEAIDVEPENSYYSANYAHFLWNTGGEETCVL